MVVGADPAAALAKKPRSPDADPRAFTARIRAELHRLLGALARRDFEQAQSALRDGEGAAWTTDRLAAESGALLRRAQGDRRDAASAQPAQYHADFHCHPDLGGPAEIVDPAGDEDFAIHTRIDLTLPLPPGQENAPLIELVRIGR